jgi:hypothetical protein
MFVSSPVDVSGRRALIVEDDASIASDMAGWARNQGGNPVGPVSTPEAAFAYFDLDPDIDAILVDVCTANGLATALRNQFHARGVDVMWIIGDDGWFFDPEAEATVYRLETDADNVVRVKWPLK